MNSCCSGSAIGSGRSGCAGSAHGASWSYSACRAHSAIGARWSLSARRTARARRPCSAGRAIGSRCACRAHRTRCTHSVLATAKGLTYPFSRVERAVAIRVDASRYGDASRRARHATNGNRRGLHENTSARSARRARRARAAIAYVDRTSNFAGAECVVRVFVQPVVDPLATGFAVGARRFRGGFGERVQSIRAVRAGITCVTATARTNGHDQYTTKSQKA